MDDLQESSANSVASTGGNKTATGTPGELDEAFTISVREILCINLAREMKVHGTTQVSYCFFCSLSMTPLSGHTKLHQWPAALISF